MPPSPDYAVSTQPAERRFSPRVRVTYRVELKCGSRRIVGHTRDLGAWGLFVETREDLEPGSRVRMSFAVGPSAHDLVEAHGVVARRVSPTDTARTGEAAGLGVAVERFLWGRDRFLDAYRRLLGEGRVAAGPRLERGPRASPRTPVGLPIFWGDGTGATDRAGFLTNLSRSGAFFVEAPPVPPGSRLRLWFELPVDGGIHRVKAVATVVRTVEGEEPGEGPRGMGVRLDTSSVDSRILEDFLDDRLETPEVRAGVRRHREAFGTDIEDLVLEALAELDREPPTPAPEGSSGAPTRYRLVDMEPVTPPVVDWGRVASLGFRAAVGTGLCILGMTLYQVLELL